MRKNYIISVFVIFMLALSPSVIFAKGNQSVIPLESDVYDYIDYLYQLEGHAAPVGARPWSNLQAIEIISRITPTTDNSSKLKTLLLNKLSENKEVVDFLVSLTPNISLHSNIDFNNDKYWINKDLDKRFLNLGGNIIISDYFAAELSIGIGNVPSGKYYSKTTESNKFTSTELNLRYSDIFSSNIYPFAFDLSMAGRSSITLGNEYLLFSLGRDQLSWGNGLMGNLILSNTLPYYDFIRFSAGNNSWFRYDTQVIFFTHPINYPTSHTETNKGLNFFFGNRLEFRFLSDRVRLTVNEAIMYQSKDNFLDLRLLNPLQIFHGLYISDQANSLASAEIEVGLSKNWQLYTSFAVDDLAVGGESQPPYDRGSTPNSWGLMGGIRSAYAIGEGILSGILEGVYITPLTYHRRTGNYVLGDTGAYNDHSLDYIGSIRYVYNDLVYYKRRYLSFPFGSDALAFKLKLSYDVPFKFTAESHLFFMAHGATDEDSEIYEFDGRKDVSWGWLLTDNIFDVDKGNISYTYNWGISTSYYIKENLKISSSIDLILIDNFNHGTLPKFDIQFMAGISYSI